MNRTLTIIGKRLGSLIVTLAVMSFIIFMLVEIMPGDVAQMILGRVPQKRLCLPFVRHGG